MPIDVIYEGVVLARGMKMMATPSGTFVELEHPMPVGTQLVLEEAGVACPVRVERVHEGVGPGVFIIPLVDGAVPAGDEAAPDAAADGVVSDEIEPADTEPLPAEEVDAAIAAAAEASQRDGDGPDGDDGGVKDGNGAGNGDARQAGKKRGKRRR